jgi:hypothetical protein
MLSWLRPGSRDTSRPTRACWCALVLATLLGLAPLAFEVGRTDPFVAPVTWSLLALPCGVAAGACGARLWPFGLLPPVVWMLGYAFAQLSLERPAPTPAWAGLATAGLYALGAAVGALTAPRVWPGAAAALAFAAVLVALPGRAGITERTWAESSPRAARWLLDASPATLVVECAGLDWMRHRSVYHPAGTDWFSDVRRPYRGALAAPVVLVVGCGLAWLARRSARRTDTSAPRDS